MNNAAQYPGKPPHTIVENRIQPFAEVTMPNKVACVPRISKINKKCSGFSLLEMATTLMVMGLLLSGVLKAQGLMDSNKAHTLEDDFRNIPFYLNEYQGKFKSLPGDDATIGSVNSHLENAISCTSPKAGKCMPGNGIIDGQWNDTTAASESFLFWQQIRLAGFTAGDTDLTSANYRAKNVVGGTLGITNQEATPIVGLNGNYIVCSDGIAGMYVKQLDIALDDGDSATGSMRTTVSGIAAGGTAIATKSILDDTLYLVCMGV